MRETNQVFYVHHRTRDQFNNIHNHGGYTVAFRTVNNSIEYAVARCHEKDNFNKRLGRSIAAGRLKQGQDVTVMFLNHDDKTPGEVARYVDNCVQAELEARARLFEGA